MPSRWDLLLEKKPVPIAEHLLDEAAKLLAQDLSGWPLPIAELDLETGRRFAPLLEPGSKRPADAIFAEAFRLTRWDLEREFEAYDDYMRNQRWAEHGLSPDDKTALLFVSRWLLEQLLGLQETTRSRLSRPMLVECLSRTHRRLQVAS